jgi:hypothetical protein
MRRMRMKSLNRGGGGPIMAARAGPGATVATGTTALVAGLDGADAPPEPAAANPTGRCADLRIRSENPTKPVRPLIATAWNSGSFNRTDAM